MKSLPAALRESATTTLKKGRFLAPPRERRITTMMNDRSGKGRDFTRDSPSVEDGRRMSVRRLSDPFPDVGVDSAGQRRRIDVDQIFGGQSLDDPLEGRAVLVGERAALDVERQDPVAFAEGVSPVIRKNSVRDGLVFLWRRLQTVVGGELRKLGHYLKREADAVEGEQAFGIRSLHQRELGAI